MGDNWISLDDSYPPDERYVYVQAHYQGAPYQHPLVAFWDTDNQRWLTSGGSELLGEVSAWSPMNKRKGD